jgi:hypothetical protein
MIAFDSVSAAAHALARCHSCGRAERIEAGYLPRIAALAQAGFFATQHGSGY